MPDSRDPRGRRTGSVPGCPHHDLWKREEIPDPFIEHNSPLIEWTPQRTWLYKKTFALGEDPPRVLVLKAGSFSKPDFFERALEHLRNL